jgi:hypothetical protein
MNASKLTTTIVTSAVIAISGLVGNIAPSHAAPSPSKGVVCPVGFEGQTTGQNGFRCIKRVSVIIENICTNSNFPKLTLRDGRDICTKENVNVLSTGPLTGLNPGRDFIASVPDPQAKRRAEQRLEQAFTSGRLALPPLAPTRTPVLIPVIPAAEREAVFFFQKVVIDDRGTLDDHTVVLFDVFTFPTKKQ